jgi:hypothetical protein
LAIPAAARGNASIRVRLEALRQEKAAKVIFSGTGAPFQALRAEFRASLGRQAQEQVQGHAQYRRGQRQRLSALADLGDEGFA